MILNKEKIKEAVKSKEIIIDPFDDDLLKSASYTFLLGNKMRKLKPVEFIDSRTKIQEFEEFEMGKDGYLLKPGEFIICHTKERLKLSDTIACFLSMKGSPAQIGLDALTCEMFCEPGSEGGWEGKLMLETTNNGPYPIKLFLGIKIIKGIFVQL